MNKEIGMVSEIFNEVTSYQELNKTGGIKKMPKKSETNAVLDDFTDNDKVVGASIEFWNFKEEKEIVGLFLEMVPDNYNEHAVLNTGEQLVHLPNLTALNGKLKKAKVSADDKVKVVYLGEVKSKKTGRMYEDFDVFVKSQ